MKIEYMKKPLDETLGAAHAGMERLAARDEPRDQDATAPASNKKKPVYLPPIPTVESTAFSGLDYALGTGWEAGLSPAARSSYEARAAGNLRMMSNVAETQQPYRAERKYPLISWVAAGCWQESCDNFSPGDADEWLVSDADAGVHGYWLEVKGPSMLPTFAPGVRVLVRPENFDLISGKYYVAKLLDTGETTFKQYLRDGGASYLQPLNPAFPVLAITESVAIIGVVVDAKLPRSLF